MNEKERDGDRRRGIKNRGHRATALAPTTMALEVTDDHRRGNAVDTSAQSGNWGSGTGLDSLFTCVTLQYNRGKVEEGKEREREKRRKKDRQKEERREREINLKKKREGERRRRESQREQERE